VVPVALRTILETVGIQPHPTQFSHSGAYSACSAQ
jgi:hypothetical protein